MLSDVSVSHYDHGGLYPGPTFVLGVVCLGVSVQGISVHRGLCPGRLCQGVYVQNQKSGRYSSYWNAFLLLLCF